MKKSELSTKFLDFCGEDPEFYAYYSAYDWVLLCQLYGTMMDLPKSWPMYCKDLKQIADEKGFDTKQIPSENEHSAIDDARWNLKLFKAMNT